MTTTKKIIIGVVIAAVLCVGIGVVLWSTPVFAVKNFDITGTKNTSVEEVEQATGISVGDNMMRLDTASAAQSVAGLPWVRTVTVERSFPSTVGVEIQEREPVMFIREPDGDHLIDSTGHIFAIGEAPEGTMEVTGAAVDDPAIMEQLVDVVNAIDPEVRVQVARVNVPSEWEIEFELHDGRTVFWGAPENNHDKGLAMRTVLTREGQHWNVSNPNLVTVR